MQFIVGSRYNLLIQEKHPPRRFIKFMRQSIPHESLIIYPQTTLNVKKIRQKLWKYGPTPTSIGPKCIDKDAARRRSPSL